MSENRELVLISELCRELAKLGLGVSMSDARPAAVLRYQAVDPPVGITLDSSGECFEWRDAESRFPTADPATAARSIVDHLMGRGPESGDVL